MNSHSINKHADTQLKTDLLSYLNRHPNTKFTSGVITRAISCVRKADVEEALESFLSDEIVEKHTRQGQSFFCLADDPLKKDMGLKSSASSEGVPPPLAHSRRQIVIQHRLEEAISM